MEQRRKLKRRHLVYYLDVFERSSNRLMGHLVDLTPGGLMLLSEEPIEPGTVLHLQLALPTGVFGKDRLDLEAKSLWCDRDVNKDFFDVGFQLLNISETAAEQIEYLLNDYGFNN